MGTSFEHLRHKPPVELDSPRELVLACPILRSNVNLCRIIRTAGCSGVVKMVVGGKSKLDRKITREAEDGMEIQFVRTLTEVLKCLRGEGFPLIGLEQTTNSVPLTQFQFPKRSVLVIGHERHGIPEEQLRLMDAVVEIPVFGMPYSFNVATATAMALYEYCRKHPGSTPHA